MIYFHYFDVESEYNQARDNNYEEPWVSYIEDPVDRVNYNMTDEERYGTPVTFLIHSDGDIIFKCASSTFANSAATLQYQLNDDEWSSITATVAGITIPVSSGDTVKFIGDNEKLGGRGFFKDSTAGFKVKGNIMSLLNSTGFSTMHELPQAGNNVASYGVFYSLFESCTGLTDASRLLIPVSAIPTFAFASMFYGATSLTATPTFNCVIVSGGALDSTFRRCTALETAPELNMTSASPIGSGACNCMFYSCYSLKNVPKNYLPATGISSGSYNSMFNECTSLTSAPDLPAETVPYYGYRNMFSGCTALTSAPIISATDIYGESLAGMFIDCTSLTVAPGLRQITVHTLDSGINLNRNHFKEMFKGCVSLVTPPPELSVTLQDSMSATSLFEAMFYGCHSMKTPPVIGPIEFNLTAGSISQYVFDSMFAFCSAMTSAPDLSQITFTKGISSYFFRNTFQQCKSMTTLPFSAFPSSTSVYTSVFSGMFQYCEKLTSAPDLNYPMTFNSNTSYIFRQLFYGCSKLKSVKCNFAGGLNYTGNTSDWLYGVASSGNRYFYKNPNTSTGSTTGATQWARNTSGIPNGWTVLDIT